MGSCNHPLKPQLKGQSRCLDTVAVGESIEEASIAVVEAVEELLAPAVGSILLIQGNRLCCGVAPNLPQDYCHVMEELFLNQSATPSLQSVYRREPTIVTNLATANFSDRYQSLILQHRLRSCWSMPIFGRGRGEATAPVLGVITVYFPEKRSPLEENLAILRQIARMAAIAIEQQLRSERSRLDPYVGKQQLTGKWTLDVASQRLAWSTKIFPMHALAPAQQTSTFVEYLQMLPPEDRQRLQQSIEQTISGGSPCLIEYKMVSPDGSIHYYESRAEASKDAQGRVTRLLGTTLDITTRKQAELALQTLVAERTGSSKTAFFSSLVRQIANSLDVTHVIVTQKTGDRLDTLAFWANGKLRPPYSYSLAHTPCEYVFQAGEFYCNSDVQHYFPQDLDLVELEAESYLGLALLSTQGESLGHLYVLNQQPIANVFHAKHTLRIFAARAAAELERLQAGATIRQQLAAIEATIDGISFLQEGRYIFVNRAHLELFGYDQAQDLLDQEWSILYTPSEVDRINRTILPSLDQNRAWRGEVIAIRKDRSTFIADLSLTLNDDGLLIQVCRDISERKQAETALQNLVTGTAATTGRDFFPALTQHIADALQVSYAIVSEWSDNKLHTLAFWANGALQSNLAYDPAKTPCELTLQTGEVLL